MRGLLQKVWFSAFFVPDRVAALDSIVAFTADKFHGVGCAAHNGWANAFFISCGIGFARIYPAFILDEFAYQCYSAIPDFRLRSVLLVGD